MRPGIGKTRLLEELATRAAARGQLVLQGSASELEQELPFGVFVDALDEHVAAVEPRRWSVALENENRAELAYVLPSTGRPGDFSGLVASRALPNAPGGAAVA